jgi:hypothetical protein
MDQIQTMVETLTKLRSAYGDDKFKYAAAHSVRMILAQHPEKKEDLRAALKDLVDLDTLLEGPAPKYPDMPTGDMMMGAIKQSMPGIQSQAQLDVTMAAFDALRSTLNATFLLDKDGVTKGRASLDQALKTAEEVTQLTVKLSEVPEAATSPEAERFKQPPAQFVEVAVLQSLMTQVEEVTTLPDLNAWYKNNRAEIDRVVTQVHRNTLLDRIRAKKVELASE